jgi:asparagine N-glycosylation enzyme membrane subunit Stt3
LFPGGRFSLYIVWGNYTFGAFLSIAAIGVLIYQVIKKGWNEVLLLVIWSIAILITTLAILRMALLFAINVSVLMGYLGWRVLVFTGLRESKPTVEEPENSQTKRKKKRKPRPGESVYLIIFSRAGDCLWWFTHAV